MLRKEIAVKCNNYEGPVYVYGKDIGELEQHVDEVLTDLRRQGYTILTPQEVKP